MSNTDEPAAHNTPLGGAAEAGQGELQFLGDDAISSSGEDRFGRELFAARVAELLDNVSRQSESTVFGLIGPWGSGKTSVLNLLEAILASDDAWSVARFNPWQLSDIDSLIVEFFATVASPLPKSGRARKALAGYVRKIAPFTSVASVLGVDPSKAVDGLADLLGGDQSLERVRRDLEAALREDGGHHLILIDDVDRLQADELAQLLKMVRLVGRLPNVYYVLAYDEVTIIDVLGATDIAVENPRRALAYLDKIVQVRIDLPPVPRVQAGRLVDEALDTLTRRYDIALDRSDLERLSFAYQQHLLRDLSEPRHIKRMFGQIEAMYPLVRGEVDFVDFVLVTHLRTFYPDAYRLLVHHKAELTGTELTFRDKPSPAERRVTWTKRLSDSGLDEAAVARTVDLLGLLFEPLAGLGSHAAGRAERQRVGSSEYFDRYFFLAVQPDDIADAVVQGAIEEAITGTTGPSTETLLRRLNEAAEACVDKLRRFSPDDPHKARALIPFAASIANSVPEAGLFGRSQAVARVWLSELLESADLSDPTSILSDLISHGSLGTAIGGLLTAKQLRDRRGDDANPAMTPLTDLAIDAIRAQLVEYSEILPWDLPPGVIQLLNEWRQLAGVDPVRDWLHEVLDVGAWKTEDFVALCVPLAYSASGISLSDMPLEWFDEVIGIEFALSRFAPTTQATDINWEVRTDTSFEERRRRAHAILSRQIPAQPAGEANDEHS
jgi:energy-coupling factor transporter ATP-binding protein EcfA2